ncbi:MAG: hypothetical protein ACOYLN_12365 [Blastocatellia bacterium]|jgi:hypothetical protein
MSNIDESDEQSEESSVTAEEFSILTELFQRADVEADIEGDSITFTGLVEGGERKRFARIRLLPFAHQVAHRVLQTGGEYEMFAMIGLLEKMKSIFTEYLETDDLSNNVEVVEEEELLEELSDYRNF